MSQHNSIQGCNISMDRFTSVSLAEWANENNFTIVGTMRLDRKGIPHQVKVVTNRGRKIYAIRIRKGWRHYGWLSYLDKKKSGKKECGWYFPLCMTMSKRPEMSVENPISTPRITQRGGVDVVDLISSYLSTRIKSKRWPINSLAFLLDTVRTNAKTIICDNDIKY